MSDRVKGPRPPLPVPLDRVLDEGMDELALERTWRRVASTRDADLSRGGGWRRWRLKRWVPIGVTVAAAVVAAQPLAEQLGKLWAEEATNAQVSPGPLGVGVEPEGPPELVRTPAVGQPRPVEISPQPMVIPELEAVAAPIPTQPLEQARVAPSPSPRRAVKTQAQPGSVEVDEEPAVAVPTPALWAERWRSGDLDGALAALGSHGLAEEIRRNRSVDELFLLADLARVTGRPAEALAALERVGKLHPGAPWGGLAAFTAGKLKLETTGDAQGAAAAFSRALELGLPEALAEQAVARREEALRRAGGSD